MTTLRAPCRWPAAAIGGGWVKTQDRRPQPGSLIVKRWRQNGAVWAGVYSGTEKDSSFDEWVALPTDGVEATEPADPFTVSAALRRLIADDAYAMTFQTFGQYRTALLKAIDNATAAAGVRPTDGGPAK